VYASAKRLLVRPNGALVGIFQQEIHRCQHAFDLDAFDV
jgi:hypothetical protein